MTAFRQDIEVFRGDTLPLRVTVKDETGAAYNLTGISAIVYGIAKAGTPGAVISKSLGSGVVVTDAAAGIFEVTVPANETVALAGKHEHQARITTSGASILTVMHGTVQFRFAPAG